MEIATEQKTNTNKLSIFDDDYVITDEDREVIAEFDEAIKINGVKIDESKNLEFVKTDYGFAMCKKEDIEKMKSIKLELPPLFKS